MILSRKTLPDISSNQLDLPKENLFLLPEKVLQFGTGVLLRGLPDYFIDKANKQGVFNGRVVVVKSTSQGRTYAFAYQDCLYTHCIRGLEGEIKIEENIVNASISRVLSANKHWNEILECAANPEMEIVISNTTEVG
ncbi:MAG: tagaturonate reductase, partial [Segetibacter sp.]